MVAMVETRMRRGKQERAGEDSRRDLAEHEARWVSKFLEANGGGT
jgi:hypothetical protein